MTHQDQMLYLARLYDRMGDQEAAEFCRQQAEEDPMPLQFARDCDLVTCRCCGRIGPRAALRAA